MYKNSKKDVKSVLGNPGVSLYSTALLWAQSWEVPGPLLFITKGG